uniref:dolichyl-phosphate beta-glucosyltransferase n=1 Tax=Blastobotrys adeninivorans TaxID=409370 RepID=A0A060TGT3_BLAAD
MSTTTWIVSGLTVIAVAVLALYVLVAILAHTPRAPQESELKYVTNGSEGLWKFGDVNKPESVDISVVIPAYNETERLAVMLDEAVPFLDEHFSRKYEIILVDDGSKDGTAKVAVEWAVKNDIPSHVLRVVTLGQNRGKGGAVAHGMQFVRGKYALFADADGASKFSDVSRLLEAVQKRGAAVAVGSRAHLVSTEAVVKRSFIRNFLMHGLHLLVYVFGVKSIRDTQCGFKLFTHDAAHRIFPFLHNERWIFDVEVLMVAQFKGLPIEEVPISWHEVSGSKIDIARDSIIMAVDLVVMRMAFIFGIYNPHQRTHEKVAL